MNGPSISKNVPESNEPSEGLRPPTKRVRFLFFRLAAMVLGTLPFFVAELTLSVLDLPSRKEMNDPFLDLSQLAPLFEQRANGTYHIPPERMRLFAPAEFAAIKPPNTTRVFSLGGSTTQGEPYGPQTAFSSWLAMNLEMADPSRNWEMINCGGLSYASYRVLPILREVLAYDPDLIVVYCGQNEFLEARELSGWKETPTFIAKAASQLYRLRSPRFVASFVQPEPSLVDGNRMTRLNREVDALLDSRGGLEKYHRCSLNRHEVVASFRWNLQQMVDTCQAGRIPLLLIVPTVNLRDCPPFKVETDPMLHPRDREMLNARWEVVHDEATTVDQRRVELQRILEIDPEHCGAHYCLGQIALADRNFDLARHHLTAAKDFDVCPLRAITEIQQTVRQVASMNHLLLLDADKLFESKSPNGLVGQPWLIDHVHPGIEGHQWIGEELAELLIRSAFIRPSNKNWRDERAERYRMHLGCLGENYFYRGKQKLEGLLLWTQGRAKPESR